MSDVEMMCARKLKKIVPLFFFAVFVNLSIHMQIPNYMRCREF